MVETINSSLNLLPAVNAMHPSGPCWVCQGVCRPYRRADRSEPKVYWNETWKLPYYFFNQCHQPITSEVVACVRWNLEVGSWNLR